MVANIRKGSKVFISVSGRGLKNTPAVVTSTAGGVYIDVRVTSGFAKGKTLLRLRKQVRRRN